MTLLLFLAVQDVDGLRLHALKSERQSGETVVRVLLPAKPAERAPVVFILPVEAGRESKTGDGLLEAKKLDLHNKHGVICVQPSFAHCLGTPIIRRIGRSPRSLTS